MKHALGSHPHACADRNLLRGGRPSGDLCTHRPASVLVGVQLDWRFEPRNGPFGASRPEPPKSNDLPAPPGDCRPPGGLGALAANPQTRHSAVNALSGAVIPWGDGLGPRRSNGELGSGRWPGRAGRLGGALQRLKAGQPASRTLRFGAVTALPRGLYALSIR